MEREEQQLLHQYGLPFHTETGYLKGLHITKMSVMIILSGRRNVRISIALLPFHLASKFSFKYIINLLIKLNQALFFHRPVQRKTCPDTLTPQCIIQQQSCTAKCESCTVVVPPQCYAEPQPCTVAQGECVVSI